MGGFPLNWIEPTVVSQFLLQIVWEWVCFWGSFSLRMGQFSNPVATHPRTNEVEVSPLPQGLSGGSKLIDQTLLSSKLKFAFENWWKKISLVAKCGTDQPIALAETSKVRPTHKRYKIEPLTSYFKTQFHRFFQKKYWFITTEFYRSTFIAVSRNKEEIQRKNY